MFLLVPTQQRSVQSEHIEPVFFGHRPQWFWNDRKKLSHFGQNVWKYRLMNTVTVSFLYNCDRNDRKCFSDQKVSAKNYRNISEKKISIKLTWLHQLHLFYISSAKLVGNTGIPTVSACTILTASSALYCSMPWPPLVESLWRNTGWPRIEAASSSPFVEASDTRVLMDSERVFVTVEEKQQVISSAQSCILTSKPEQFKS